MTYGLRRGPLWIAAPPGDFSNQIVPPALGLCSNPDHAWTAPTIEMALLRVQLIKDCWGWNTEPRAIRSLAEKSDHEN